jgi:hypothetical protein
MSGGGSSRIVAPSAIDVFKQNTKDIEQLYYMLLSVKYRYDAAVGVARAFPSNKHSREPPHTHANFSILYEGRAEGGDIFRVEYLGSPETIIFYLKVNDIMVNNEAITNGINGHKITTEDDKTKLIGALQYLSTSPPIIGGYRRSRKQRKNKRQRQSKRQSKKTKAPKSLSRRRR